MFFGKKKQKKNSSNNTSCNEVKTTQVLLLAFWNLASVSWYWNINVRFCLINHALIRIRRWYRCAVLKQFPRIRFMSKSPRTTRAALLRCDHGLSAYTQPQSPSFHLHLVSRNSSSIVPAVANCQTLRHRNTNDPSSPGLWTRFDRSGFCSVWETSTTSTASDARGRTFVCFEDFETSCRSDERMLLGTRR